MIDQHNDALDSVGQNLAPRCPHLGTQRDPETWFTFPADENHCHKASPIQPISIDHQSTHCLAEQYGECPVYKAQQARWVGSLPKGIKGKTPFPVIFTARNFLIAGGIIGFLAAVAFLSVMILPRLFNNDNPRPNPTVTITPIEITATPQPTTETPTPTATAATSTIPTLATTIAVVSNGDTPTPTRPPIFASVAFETNLRDGPSTENAVLGSIPGGTEFLVLGRDTLGVWLFVEVEGLGQGWVFADQIEEDIEILTLPIIYVGTTSTRVPGGSGSGGSTAQPTSSAPTATPLPQPPDRFTIELELDPAPASCDDSFLVVFYDVTLRDDSLIMERDNVRLTGDYDPETGEFEVFTIISSGQFVGVHDTITGTLVYENRRVTIEGIQTWTNTAEGCTYTWDVEGTSEPVD